MTPAELCVMDPVNVSIHFHKKWKAIFSKLIKSRTTPLFEEDQDTPAVIKPQNTAAASQLQTDELMTDSEIMEMVTNGGNSGHEGTAKEH